MSVHRDDLNRLSVLIVMTFEIHSGRFVFSVLVETLPHRPGEACVAVGISARRANLTRVKGTR